MKKILLILLFIGQAYAGDASEVVAETPKEPSPAEKFNALNGPKEPINPFSNVQDIIQKRKAFENAMVPITKKPVTSNSTSTSLESMSVIKDLTIEEINIQKYQNMPRPTFNRLIPDDVLK